MKLFRKWFGAKQQPAKSAKQLDIDQIFPKLKKGKPEINQDEATIEINGNQFNLAVDDVPLYFDLQSDFTVYLVADMGDTLQYIKQKDLVQLGVTKEALFAQAQKNFLLYANVVMRKHATHFEGIHMVYMDQELESTAAILVPMLQKLQESIESKQLFFTMPLADLFFFWGDGVTADGLKAMQEATKEAKKQAPVSRQVSDYVYQFKNQKIERLQTLLNDD